MIKQKVDHQDFRGADLIRAILSLWRGSHSD